MNGWGFAAAVALVISGVGTVSAQSQLSPEAYAEPLHVYVDGLLEQRAAIFACGTEVRPTQQLAIEAEQWDRARRILAATLWANGFPARDVRTIDKKLQQPWDGEPDCSDPYTNLGSAQSWPERIAGLSSVLGLTLMENPVSPEQWTAIKAVFEREKPLEKRALTCIAVIDPTLLLTEFKTWNDVLLRTGEMLIGAGLPRDEVVAEITAAQPDNLWERVEAQEKVALRDSCGADQTWQERVYMLQQMRLSSDVEKLLQDISR